MNDAARAIRKLSLLGAWMLVIHPGFAQEPAHDLGYFQLSRVPSSAQRFLLAAGTRLRRPGKERITAVGSLSTRGVVTPVEITLEFPQRIRIDDGRGTVTFDRANPSEAVPQKRETADAIETLLEDSLEGFFAAQRGGSIRSLGAGFRGKTANPEEPSFEIAEVWSPSRFRNGAEPTIKQYWFDSRTKLLSRVVYRVASVPGSDLVEVLWSDWRDVEGERVPFRLERKEAGQVTLQLVLTSVLVSPKADDGRFPGR